MRGSNMRKELCHVSPSISSLSVLVVVSWQEGKREAFYTLRPTLTTPLHQGHLMEKSQFKDYNPTTSHQFCLGICLDLPPRPSCLVQDVITKFPTSYPQVDGVMVKVNGMDQPINLAISFAQNEITQIQGHRWVRQALITLGHPFPRKRLQIGSLSRILHHGAFLLALGTT
jgi:hypothetical protein